jgi:hypothetical protein
MKLVSYIQTVVAGLTLLPSGFGFQAASPFKSFTAAQEIYTNCVPPKPCTDPQTKLVTSRRADGAMSVTTWEKSDPKFPHSIVILQGNQRIELRPAIKAKMTFGIPTESSAKVEGAQLDPASGCTTRKDKAELFLKSPNIKGEITADDSVEIGDGTKVKAARKTIETPISTSKSWYAPDYACFEIKTEFVRKAVRAAGGQTTIKLTRSISSSEPEVAAFAVPADYVEMKPTELRKAYHFYTGKLQGASDADLQSKWNAIVESNQITFEMDDKRYVESRTAAGLK